MEEIIRVNSILVTRLRNFVRGPDICSYFKAFGDIVIVRFLHEKPFSYHNKGTVLDYTGCCVVEFKTTASVDLVLDQHNHIIRNGRVIVERFYGREYHKHLLLKGKWRLMISGLPNTANLQGRRFLYDDKLAYAYIENRFGQFGYNRVKLYKNNKYDYTGTAKLRFTSQAACRRALEHVQGVMHLNATSWGG